MHSFPTWRSIRSTILLGIFLTILPLSLHPPSLPSPSPAVASLNRLHVQLRVVTSSTLSNHFFEESRCPPSFDPPHPSPSLSLSHLLQHVDGFHVLLEVLAEHAASDVGSNNGGYLQLPRRQAGIRLS